VLEETARQMRASVEGGRATRQAYGPGRPRVPALRHADPLVAAGRRRPPRLLVPGVPTRSRAQRWSAQV